MARARAVITTWGSCIQRHPMTPPRPNPAPHQANRLGHLSGPLGQLSGRILSRKHRGPVARNHSKSTTQQDAIGGQGRHSAKRPDWACKPNHFPVFVSQKENFAIFARAFFTLQAQLWQLGAGARVRRHPVVNQGALRTRVIDGPST